MVEEVAKKGTRIASRTFHLLVAKPFLIEKICLLGYNAL
jgi:hypothetical protein